MQGNCKINLRIASNTQENVQLTKLLEVNDTHVKSSFSLEETNYYDKPHLFENSFDSVCLPSQSTKDIYEEKLKLSVLDTFNNKPFLLMDTYSQTLSNNTFLYSANKNEKSLFYYILNELFNYINNENKNHYLISLNKCLLKQEHLYDCFDTSDVSKPLFLSCDKDGNSIIRNITERTILSAEQGVSLIQNTIKTKENETDERYSNSVVIINILMEQNDTYIVLNKLYLISSFITPFINETQGIQVFYQNIYNMFYSKNQSKKFINKIWKLCYITKKCFESPSSVFLFFSLNNNEIILPTDIQLLETILTILKPKDPSKTLTFRLLHRQVNEYLTDASDVSSTTSTLSSKESQLLLNYALSLNVKDIDKINEINDPKVLHKTINSLIEMLRNNEINKATEIDQIEMKVRKDCLDEFLKITDKEKENDSTVNSMDNKKYQILIQQKDEELRRIKDEKNAELQELQRLLEESETECRRLYEYYDIETENNNHNEVNKDSVNSAKTKDEVSSETKKTDSDDDEEDSITITALTNQNILYEKTIQRLKNDICTKEKQLQAQIEDNKNYELLVSTRLDEYENNIQSIVTQNESLTNEIETLQEQIHQLNVVIDEQKKMITKKPFLAIKRTSAYIQSNQIKPLSGKPRVYPVIPSSRPPMIPFKPLSERIKTRAQLLKENINVPQKTIPSSPIIHTIKK